MSETVFADRREAGRRLGAALAELGFAEPGAVVAGIPRGGVVVAREVADELGVPLRAILARKLGAPHQPELAVGALGPDGTVLLDESLVSRLRIGADWLERAAAAERAELAARVERFPGVVRREDVADRTVIVVDDGVATGATAAAVGSWLAHSDAARRVLALPVGPAATLQWLEERYDELLALARPHNFVAVGQWYRDFVQVTDDEVVALLSA
jgi:putative phosphoribosyl transferase